jgi:hypothetical protein
MATPSQVGVFRLLRTKDGKMKQEIVSWKDYPFHGGIRLHEAWILNGGRLGWVIEVGSRFFWRGWLGNRGIESSLQAAKVKVELSK